MTMEQRTTSSVSGAADCIVTTLSDVVAFPSVVKVDPKEAGSRRAPMLEYPKWWLERIGFVTDLWEPDGPRTLCEI